MSFYLRLHAPQLCGAPSNSSRAASSTSCAGRAPREVPRCAAATSRITLRWLAHSP